MDLWRIFREWGTKIPFLIQQNYICLLTEHEIVTELSKSLFMSYKINP